MTAAIVLRCDGPACTARYTADARDFPAARCEAGIRGWGARPVASRQGRPADLCPRCATADRQAWAADMAARAYAALEPLRAQAAAQAAAADQVAADQAARVTAALTGLADTTGSPAPATDAWRCATCGAPEDAHPYRHPFRRLTAGRRPRQEPTP